MPLSQFALPPALSSRPCEDRRARLQCAGAGLIVVIALMDLLRWRAYPAAWTHFASCLPMSPGLAELFVLMGVSLGLRLLFPGRRWMRRTAVVLAALTVAGAMHALLCCLDGRVPRWEIWLGGSELTLNGFTIGHLSEQSAVLVLLSCLALAGLLSPPDPRALLPRAGIFAALLVGLFAVAAVLSYVVGTPLLSDDGWLKVAPLAMAEFTLFNVVLLLGARATNRLRHWFFGNDLSAPDFSSVSREERRVLGLLAGVGLVALLAGVVYLRHETDVYRTRSVEALQTMADLKTKQIEEWRRERLGDARTMMQSPFLIWAARSAVETPLSGDRREELARWLKTWAQNYGYARAVMLNRAMESIAAEPGETELAVPGLREQLRDLRPDTDVVELPPYVDGSGVLRWDLLAPLRTRGSATVDAVILLQTNPTRFIIPILQSWPPEYQTGQSVLWYREGDRLISLGGYRPAEGVTAGELRPFGMIRKISMLPPLSLPARVLRSELEVGEGLDYRGIPIIGLGQGIPGSPWFFSSRVNSGEVYAPLERTAIGLAGILAGLLAITGFATGWLWRQRKRDLLHGRLAAELEQKRLEARLGMVMRHAKDIIMVTDENMRFVDVNQQAVDAYGWTREELLQKSIADIRAPETVGDLPVKLERADSDKGVTYETTSLRRDGTTFPCEVSIRRVDVEGRMHRLAIIRDISERKKTEAKLRDSQERFSKAFQSSPIGIVISEFASGRYLEVNESFCRILKSSPEEIVGRTSMELGIWGSGEEREVMSRSLAADGFLRNFELQTRAHDGESKIALMNAERIEVNGKPCILSMVEDITDRKRAEAALRASEERYRLIAENTSDVIWLYDLNVDGFSYVSPAIFRLLGYTPQEMLGRKMQTVQTPAGAEKVRRALETRLAEFAAGKRSRSSAVIEVEQPRKDGSIVQTEVVASLLADAAGRPTHVLGVSRDITERQQAREALEKFNSELEQRVEQRTAELATRNSEIQALLDSIPDAVLLCDGGGTVISSHSPLGHESLIPSTSRDPLGRLDPRLREIAREMHALARSGDETVVREFDHSANGSAISIEARATPAGPDRLLILVRDISARKRIERDMQANLEREKQLSEMKSQFISVASHEFRTPLAAAIGSLDLLKKHAASLPEAKRRELFERAQNSLERLTAIMNDVLQLGRADSGRVKVQRMNVDLGRFVQDLVNEVAEADRHQHVFSFQQSGDADPVPADTSLLNHILSNLVGNAARYSPPGTTVSITLAVDPREFVLVVADEGIGIPEAERARIFEPFVRGTNVGQIGGTGLGLNIVKRYAELMGGTIEVLPADRGAAFRVRVPHSSESFPP
jgi:PAS domain S-box-containing protein